MPVTIEQIRATFDADDKKRARAMLKEHLRTNPSADGWYLAATWTKDRDSKIQFLRKALELDEWHTDANRLLHRLEGSAPKDAQRPQTEWDKDTGMKHFNEIDRSKSRDLNEAHKDRQRMWTQFGCMFGMMLMFFVTGFTMRAVGVISMGGLNAFLGQATPVAEVDGVPLAESETAIFRMPPALRNQATNQDMEIVDAGYLHQHDFDGRAGEQYAIFVQFLSVSANAVSQNVAIVASDGTDITASCERTTIIQSAGDTGIAYVCTLPMTGSYAVRILGVQGESVGAYFIGVEKLI
jgi:hypothetical protein